MNSTGRKDSLTNRGVYLRFLHCEPDLLFFGEVSKSDCPESSTSSHFSAVLPLTRVGCVRVRRGIVTSKTFQGFCPEDLVGWVVTVSSCLVAIGLSSKVTNNYCFWSVNKLCQNRRRDTSYPFTLTIHFNMNTILFNLNFPCNHHFWESLQCFKHWWLNMYYSIVEMR